MLIYEVGQKSTLKQIGGKAYNLAHLSSTSVEVPIWFALTSSCFNDFIYDHRDEYIKLLSKYSEENRKKIIKLIEKTEFSEEAKSKILKTIKKTFAKEDLLSIRSSATDEDGKNHSFAGMLESYLYIKQNDDIFSYIKKCYISCFSERAMKYREENGLINPKISVAVIIQKMIHPDYAGVMFTTNPQTNNTDETLISVVKGVGEKLVSGEENSTDFVVNNIGEIVIKDERGKVSLDDETLIKLQEAGQIVEKSYKPRLSQDIEFAIKDGKIYILQARPITNYSHIDKNKFRTILDNSNIIESYSGVTTPLTFTFAREVYGKIYNQTLHQFYVPEDAIKSIKKDLETMLYFYDNKVYYRLNGWYKMTSLYPGYEKNKKYMENMMGVKTPLEESKSQAKTRLVKIYARFLHKMIHMKSASSKFIAKFNRITKPYYNNKFPGYTNEQLLEVYNNLESEILDDFVTPIANDMGTMVIYGMLTDQAKKAKIHNYEGLLSNILAKQGNVESARQSKDLIAIVKEIKRDNTLYDLFTETSIEDLKAHLRGDSLLIFSKINDYIYKYGARTMGELKLETITMQQDPSFLLKIIKQYLELDKLPEEKEKSTRTSEEKYFNYFHGVKKSEAKMLVKLTKYFVRNREMLRLRRTYIYSIVRNIYLRIGVNFFDEGLIERPRDIFFLEKDEITAIIRRQKYSEEEIKEKITKRKLEYEENDKKPTNERMYFYGDIKEENMLPIYSRQETQLNTSVLSGVAGGGEIKTGVVKLVESPENADVKGYILMAKRTDPGWTVLFPMAEAIIIERGSILSHSAVVARELGITLVVGVRGLTDRVKDGDTVKVDGKNGTIEIIKRAKDEQTN